MLSKKINKCIAAGIVMIFAASSFSGCSKKTSNNEETKESMWKPGVMQQGRNSEDAVDVDEFDIDKDVDDVFCRSDIPEDAIKITDNSMLNIEKAGTYYLADDIKGNQINIKVKDDEYVRLILDNVTISSGSGPAINVEKGNFILTLKDGTTNYISDASEYSDDKTTACIYSEGNISINGAGKLEISGNYKNAIQSKENLYMLGGEVIVSSVDDGIKGKKSVYLVNTKVSVNAGDKGIQATSDSQDEGYVYINDSEINISSTSDGIKAKTIFEIDNGNINVEKAEEGIEALYIRINGGEITVNASDDGINATDGSGMDGTKPIIYINGGTVEVNADGDGIDSNGYIYMNGGNVIVNGPTNNGNGYFDYSKAFVVNGGTLFGAGSSGMLELPGEDSTQNTITAVATKDYENALVLLVDSDGNTVMSETPKKKFSAVTFSSADIKTGETYIVKIDGDEIGSVNIEGVKSTIGEVKDIGGFGGNRPEGVDMPEGMTPPEGMDLPEGMTPPKGDFGDGKSKEWS